MQAEYYRWQNKGGHNNKVDIHIDKHCMLNEQVGGVLGPHSG